MIQEGTATGQVETDDPPIEELAPVFIDLRKGSYYRKADQKRRDRQYGIVSFPRSGHNWLSRMLAEIIREHNGHSEPAALGKRGGMGLYVGLKAFTPDKAIEQEGFYAPFPVVYGSHGHIRHYGYEPNTQLYLYRDFISVWRSTKKTMQDTARLDAKVMDRAFKELETEPENLDAFVRKQRLKKMLVSGEVTTPPWWGGTMIDCFIKWVKHRWTFRKAPLKITYDELRKDTRRVLRRICDHMGVCDVMEETLDKAIAAGTRENMIREQELYGSPNPFETVNAAT